MFMHRRVLLSVLHCIDNATHVSKTRRSSIDTIVGKQMDS